MLTAQTHTWHDVIYSKNSNKTIAKKLANYSRAHLWSISMMKHKLNVLALLSCDYEHDSRDSVNLGIRLSANSAEDFEIHNYAWRLNESFKF